MNTKIKKCLECNSLIDNKSRSHFCDKCFTKLLQQKLDEE